MSMDRTDILTGSSSEECAADEPDTNDEWTDEEDSNDADDELSDPMLISEDNQVWSTAPTETVTCQADIVLQPGITMAAASLLHATKDKFLVFFPPSIVNIILKHTNAFGRELNKNHTDVDATFLHAYLAVLILAGVYRSKRQSVQELFDETYGPLLFRKIMSFQEFEHFNTIIRFAGRRPYDSEDKFAKIRYIWHLWCDTLPSFMNPYERVVVDEQLCAYGGRCAFRQHVPKEPEKYGLQFWLLACARTGYVWKIEPYLGKTARDPPDANQRQRVVLDLVVGLQGRTVTMSKRFTSHELGQRLLVHGVTMVGRIGSKELSIPPLLQRKKLPLYQSTFAFTDATTLVSYVGRKYKRTLLQSTKHTTPVVETHGKKVPEILSYYKQTMEDRQQLDKTISQYSCAQKTNRWSKVVFYNMIDISALNAFVIYKEQNQNLPKLQNSKRRVFLRDLGHELALPYMKLRCPEIVQPAAVPAGATDKPGPSTKRSKTNVPSPYSCIVRQ